MKKIVCLFICLLVTLNYAADPVVSNVTMSQRPDTKLIDIYYDISDNDGDSLSVSINGGSSYDLPATHFSGSGVVTGSNRHIVWDAGADWDGNYSTAVWFRITANDSTAPADMALIPAGSFSMGDHYNVGDSDERPVHDVYIDAFFMDKYEVSKAKWDEVYFWAVANGYSFDKAGSGTATNFPVHTVNWYDCVKWCNARSEKEGLIPVYFTDATTAIVYKSGQVNVAIDAINWSGNGYRLPTEAEWEKAARGGLSDNYYPWASSGGSSGDHIDGSKANYTNSGDPWDNATTPCGYYDGNQTPAGVDMANGYGLYDMAGNLWEWNNDRFSSSWYSQTGATNANTRGPTSGSRRVFRGGCWGNYASGTRCADRLDISPDIGYNHFGFRCVQGIISSNYYTISGTVNGDVQENVTITLSRDASATISTDSNGNYSFSNLTNGNYTVTPSKSGYTFQPPVADVTIADADVTAIDFVSTAISAPTNIVATDGTYSNLVRITWSTVQNATKYKVYRNTVNSSSGSSDISGEITGTNFDDTTATPGQLYYYWAKAGSENGWSDFSSSDSGFRQLTAPTGIAATDGTYTDKIKVDWNTSSGATKYKVYRNTVDNSSGSSDISGENTGTRFDDTTATPGQIYYYWVKAGNANGWSDFSSSDSGYALGAEPTVTPTFINFSSNIISKFIYLGNNGTLPYNFNVSVSAGSAWLSVLPDNGTVSNDTIALSAKANRSSLSDGTYEGYITVSPSVGDQIVVTARVVIAGNTVAAEANGPYYADQGSPVTFSAAGSQGYGLMYRWEVGLDFITPYNSDFYSYTYTNTFIPATYDVLLTVRDTNSPPHLAADVTTLIINNVQPIVDVGGPYTGSTTAAVFFTAQVTDPGILDSHEYRWDFENDGVWDTGWQSANTASHTYNIGENYLMQCEAKDNYGGVGSDSATVIIDQPNVPPIADAVIYSTTQVETNLPGLSYVVILDGSDSYDHDSKPLPLYYDWREDVDNPVKNVITEINKHEEIPTTQPLTKPGIYKFHLVVFDGEYNSEPSTITVRVPGWEGEVICEGFIAKIPLWGVNIIVTNTYTQQLDDSGRTDTEGIFLADSGSGYQVAYLDRRNYKQSKSINVGLAGTFTENIYFLPNYYIYAGQVVTGSPGNYVGIIGAKVEALIGNGVSSLTDLMGAFGFGSLPESWPIDGEPYKVRLQREGFKSEVIDLLLTMNRNSEIILMSPSSGTIEVSGTVYSAHSYLPVEDVVVDFGNGWCVTSGVEGIYGPIAVPEGEYAVKMSKEGFDNTYEYTSELNADTELNLAIEGGEISVYGVVYDGNGMVITDAVIEVVTPITGLRLTSSSNNNKATGAGYFDVTMAKGDRIIIVSAPGYEDVELFMDVNDHTKRNVVLIPEPGTFMILIALILSICKYGKI